MSFLKRIKQFISSPPMLAVIAAACILTIALYTPPFIGMADNGDFYRVINGNGIYKLDRDQDDQYFQYFSREYGIYQYYNESGTSIFSSQTLFIRAALALDRLFTGNDNVFDIRFLSALVSIWALLAVYFLVDYASWGLKKRYGYCVAALAVVIFFDTGYTAYFSSFYAEGIVSVSFLTAMSCALLIFQNRYRPYPLVVLYMFSSLILISAKQQNAPLGFFLGLLILPMMRFIFFRKQNDRRGRARLRRIATAGCALLLCTCGAFVYFVIPQEFVNINKYHAMTRGVLMTSQNPEEALEPFGIDPQYSLLDGTIYFDYYPAMDVEGEALNTEFYPKYGFISITAYYLKHPDQVGQMLDIAAKNAYSIRPQAMGNFERSAGREPGRRASFFTLHSYLKEHVIPNTVGFMIIWNTVMLGLSFRDRYRTLALAFAILMGLSQIGVSIIGAGDADLSKHIFLYNVAFDFTYFMIISTLFFQWRSKKHSAPEKAGKPAEKPEPLPEHEMETVS